MSNEHVIYESSVRQLNGVIAERDALLLANAAKQEQIAGLVEERDALRVKCASLQTTLDQARRTSAKWQAAYLEAKEGVTP